MRHNRFTIDPAAKLGPQSMYVRLEIPESTTNRHTLKDYVMYGMVALGVFTAAYAVTPAKANGSMGITVNRIVVKEPGRQRAERIICEGQKAREKADKIAERRAREIDRAIQKANREYQKKNRKK